MKDSLGARIRYLHISAKDVWRECNSRGRKISYNSVLRVIEEPYSVLKETEAKVFDTVSELEKERQITLEK